MSLGVGPLDGCTDRTQDLNVVHKTIPSTTRGDPSLSPVLLGNRRHPTHAAINFAEKLEITQFIVLPGSWHCLEEMESWGSCGP